MREQVVRPLQTLSNMLAAIREQDYSLRARRSRPDDALGLAMLELNTLMNELRERRLGALEATALLRRVVDEIDVAVMAFDDDRALRLVNAAGERMLGQPAERLLGRKVDELGLAPVLSGDAPRLIELDIGGHRGRWELRRGAFRQGGRPHQFVVLADVTRALREEERLAWQRVIRVLGHEINNSLTPIRSLADRMRQLLARDPGQEGCATISVAGSTSSRPAPTHSPASWGRTPAWHACPRRGCGRWRCAPGWSAPPGSRRGCRSRSSPDPTSPSPPTGISSTSCSST